MLIIGLEIVFWLSLLFYISARLFQNEIGFKEHNLDSRSLKLIKE